MPLMRGEAFSVNIKVRFPGGKRAYAECKGFTIETDQSEKHGGDGSAPSPFDLFLCSLATCMGVYALNFGEKHGLSSEDLTLDLKSDKDSESGLVRNIEVTVVVPEHTPAPVRNGLARAVGHCMVKRHLEQAPSFDILVK